MKTIKFLSTYAKGNTTFKVGDIAALNNQEAEQLINSGYATLYTVPQRQVSVSDSDIKKFNPKFGVAPYFSTTSIRTSIMSEPQIINYVNRHVGYGITDFCLMIDIEPYASDLALYEIMQTLPKIQLIVDTAIEKGLRISCVKFHNIYAKTNWNTIDKASWMVQHKAKIIQVLDLLQPYSIEYCCVLNEGYPMWQDATALAFMLDIIAVAKTYGYKVSMTGGLTDVRYLMPADVLAAIDCFMFNIYPTISNKDRYTTYADGKTGWECSKAVDYIEYYKRLYPTKPIIISETGIQSNWQALAYPANYVWTTQDYADATGEPVAIYLYGLLEVLKNANIEHVWWFYDINYEPCVKLLKDYLVGV